MNEETITLKKSEYLTILRFALQTANALVMCAPRFAAGSDGESVLNAACNSREEILRRIGALTAPVVPKDEPEPVKEDNEQ